MRAESEKKSVVGLALAVEVGRALHKSGRASVWLFHAVGGRGSCMIRVILIRYTC